LGRFKYFVTRITIMAYMLVYDIPKELASLRVRVNRSLHAMNAKLVQHSVWKSKNLKGLMEVAKLIKANGGKAYILEEKFAFS